MGRILIAGLVGGIVMFIWGAVAHMMTPLGDMGVKKMPNDKAMLSAFSDNIKEPGLYGFPAAAMGKEGEKADVPEGPIGILVINPKSKWEMSPVMLGLEFCSNLLAAILVAIVAVNLRGPYVARVMLIALLGVVGWLSISASYWIWYQFPRDFTAAEGAMQFVGWLASGIAIAAIARPTSMQPAMVMQ